ncbi:hypothetical protein [Nonomuraea sp. B1E8]|uniref:hypothetical protein n=1 Tax=unclassified Nonomuraea TaxID=2593643 RepID=UPI00325EB6FA
MSLNRARPGRELEHSLRAWALFRQAGDAIGEARALNNASWCPAAETSLRLGEMRLLAGDSTAALDAWKRAAEFYDALGDVKGEAVRQRMAALDRP